MKNILAITFFLCLTIVCFGQESQEVSIFDQEVPNNPSFVLLDKAPETVQRPNSSRALGLSILQDVATDGVLNDIAIEVTPFWLSSKLDRCALKFYGVDKNEKQNYLAKIKQATFSAAYVKSSDSVINVSIGARATLFEVKRKGDVEAYLKAYLLVEENLRSKNAINKEYKLVEKRPENTNDMDDAEFKEKYIDAYNQRRKVYREKRLEEFANPISEIVKRKPLLAIDIAAAYNHRYYNNEFDNNNFGRFGVWGTFVLYPNIEGKDFLNIYIFSRYLIEGDNPYSSVTTKDKYNAFDLGIKGELEFNKVSIGYEYINRTGDLDGYRSAGTIKYRAFENIYLTGTFGNNFEEQDDLITLFGIQWGFNSLIQSVGIAK